MMLWRLLTFPFQWMVKKLCRFLLPVVLSFGVAIAMDGFLNQSKTEIQPIVFSVRQTGRDTTRSCLDIYETESYQEFERLCRIKNPEKIG